MQPRRPDRPEERDRALERRVVLGGEAGDHVGVEGEPGDGRAGALDDSRVLAGRIPPAHPPQDAVVARLQRQVQVRQRPWRTADPGPEQLVVHVLRLDRREAQPLDIGLGEDPADEAGQRQRGAGVRAAVASSDQPPSYVPTLIPVSTTSRCPAATARRTSWSTSSGARERSGPRARGMMQ